MGNSESSPWMPATVEQKMALDCEAEMLFYGGAAGGLKTHSMLLDAAQEIDNPNLRAIVFRRTYPQLTDVIDKSHRLYKPLGGVWNEQKKVWTFPSGAQIRLGYIAADKDVYEYWGQEYSFIGFDESTMLTEFQIRTLISRLRSTDRSLKRRVRLASNPGGVGAAWHKKMFLRNACPIHEPEKCAVAGKLYSNAVWPSDGVSVPLSIAFIPAYLTSHNLLGEEYVKLLRTQSGSLANQLESGCWCEMQGAYFGKVWNPKTMVIPRRSVGEQYWWSFFAALDYGFGKSWAAAGLYVKTPAMDGFPNGKIVKLQELLVPNMPAHDFGKLVAAEFFAPVVAEQYGVEYRRNIQVVYLDPANFNANYDRRVGDGHTVADQLNEEFEPFGLACTPASNDRIGGWQLVYHVLDTGEFVISDSCSKTADAIPSRMHDEKRPGDVMKVPGDPLDDQADECLVAGTMITTETGDKPIENIVAGDMVLTRWGYYPVSRAWMTNPCATTSTVMLSDGRSITGTGQHPVYTEHRGFIPLNTLRYGDNVLSLSKNESYLPQSTKLSSMELCFGAIRVRQSDTCGSTTIPDTTTESAGSACCIRRSGKRLTEHSPRGITSITEIVTPSTMTSEISNACLPKPILRSTPLTGLNNAVAYSRRKYGLPHVNGTVRRLAKTFIASWQNRCGPIADYLRSIVAIVAMPMKPVKCGCSVGSAVMPASRHGAALRNWMTCDLSANNAASPSWLVASPPANTVLVHVADVRTGPNTAVYNLSVDGPEEYFANGILVHNCRYAIYSFITSAPKPKEIRIQEAMAQFTDDPTNAMIAAQKEKARIYAEEHPTALGGNLRQRLQRMAQQRRF